VAFGLVVSIVTGGYSSIFNASPILVDWHNWSERRRSAAPEARAARPAPVEPERAAQPTANGALPSTPPAGLGVDERGDRQRAGGNKRRRGGRRRR